MRTFKRSSGFTLIELMVVILIVGILSSVAYPAYTAYITKGKNSDAKAALIKAQIAQEKYRTSNATYATTIGAAGITTPSPDGYYTIAISGTPDATTYTVTATPLAPFTDTTCGTFAINQSGRTTSASIQTTSAKVEECW